jgi:superfamily II DNA or RNA helicase
MIILTINNSYSNISGLSVEQEKKLRTALSYTVGGSSAYFSGYGVCRKSLLDKYGNFATGLLGRVKAILGNSIEVIRDTRAFPILKSIKVDAKPYSFQEQAVKIAIKKRRGIISAPTGSGKSLIIALIAARLGLPTLVVVPSLEIKKQLYKTIISVLGDIHAIDVENIDSTALKTRKYYGCLIIDEAHHAAAKTYQKLNKIMWIDIPYRFFLTATPFRNDPEEELLFEGIAGEIIYKLDYKTAIKENYIVPVEAYYIEMPKIHTDAHTWQEVYKDLIINHERRNKIISNLITNLAINGKAVICLVKEIKHGNILSNLSLVPFVSGENDSAGAWIERFNSTQVPKALIGTTGILGEGIDTRPCEYIIIAGLGKAKSQFMQQVGRAVRKYPGKKSAKIIIIKDNSHKFTIRHFKIQCKILKDEYGITPIGPIIYEK